MMAVSMEQEVFSLPPLVLLQSRKSYLPDATIDDMEALMHGFALTSQQYKTVRGSFAVLEDEARPISLVGLGEYLRGTKDSLRPSGAILRALTLGQSGGTILFLTARGGVTSERFREVILTTKDGTKYPVLIVFLSRRGLDPALAVLCNVLNETVPGIHVLAYSSPEELAESFEDIWDAYHALCKSFPDKNPYHSVWKGAFQPLMLPQGTTFRTLKGPEERRLERQEERLMIKAVTEAWESEETAEARAGPLSGISIRNQIERFRSHREEASPTPTSMQHEETKTPDYAYRQKYLSSTVPGGVSDRATSSRTGGDGGAEGEPSDVPQSPQRQSYPAAAAAVPPSEQQDVGQELTDEELARKLAEEYMKESGMTEEEYYRQLDKPSTSASPGDNMTQTGGGRARMGREEAAEEGIEGAYSGGVMYEAMHDLYQGVEARPAYEQTGGGRKKDTEEQEDVLAGGAASSDEEDEYLKSYMQTGGGRRKHGDDREIFAGGATSSGGGSVLFMQTGGGRRKDSEEQEDVLAGGAASSDEEDEYSTPYMQTGGGQRKDSGEQEDVLTGGRKEFSGFLQSGGGRKTLGAFLAAGENVSDDEEDDLEFEERMNRYSKAASAPAHDAGFADMDEDEEGDEDPLEKMMNVLQRGENLASQSLAQANKALATLSSSAKASAALQPQSEKVGHHSLVSAGPAKPATTTGPRRYGHREDKSSRRGSARREPWPQGKQPHDSFGAPQKRQYGGRAPRAARNQRFGKAPGASVDVSDNEDNNADNGEEQGPRGHATAHRINTGQPRLGGGFTGPKQGDTFRPLSGGSTAPTRPPLGSQPPPPSSQPSSHTAAGKSGYRGSNALQQPGPAASGPRGPSLGGGWMPAAKVPAAADGGRKGAAHGGPQGPFDHLDDLAEFMDDGNSTTSDHSDFDHSETLNAAVVHDQRRLSPHGVGDPQAATAGTFGSTSMPTDPHVLQKLNALKQMMDSDDSSDESSDEEGGAGVPPAQHTRSFSEKNKRKMGVAQATAHSLETGKGPQMLESRDETKMEGGDAGAMDSHVRPGQRLGAVAHGVPQAATAGYDHDPAAKEDKVHFSVFAESYLGPSYTSSIHLWSFLENQMSSVMEQAKAAGTEIRSSMRNFLHVAKGFRITAQVSLPKEAFAADPRQMRQDIVWNGKEECMMFPFRVKKDAVPQRYEGRATITAGTHSAVLTFFLDIVPKASADKARAGDASEAAKFKQAQTLLKLTQDCPMIPATSIMFTQQMLGSGYFGTAELVRLVDGRDAVLKRLKNAAHAAELEHEAAVQFSIGQHPNVIPLYGYGNDTQGSYMVLEYAPRGSLDGCTTLVPSSSSTSSPSSFATYTVPDPMAHTMTTPALSASPFPYKALPRAPSTATSIALLYDEFPVMPGGIPAATYGSLPREGLSEEEATAGLWEDIDLLDQGGSQVVPYMKLYVAKRDGGSSAEPSLGQGSYYGSGRGSTRVRWHVPFIRAATDIASGLLAIHEAGLLHRDLSARNCLVSADGTVKLSDFGLAVQVPNSKELLDISTAPLPLWSMAPESLETVQTFSAASDTWMLGMTYLELYTGKQPYSFVKDPHMLLQCIKRGEKPPLPSSMDPKLKNLINECLSLDPGCRPTVSDVWQRLRKL